MRWTPLAIALLSAGCSPALVGFPGDAPFTRPSFGPADGPTPLPPAQGPSGTAGLDCTDLDGDGAGIGLGCAVVDCDDAVAAVHPGAVETCGNGLDDDCDGAAAGCGLTGDLPAIDGIAALEPGGHLGWAMAAIGGGLVAVGAPGTNGDAGAVWIVERSGEGLALVGLVSGGAAGQLAGAAVAVGDLDGDGGADLVIGAPGTDGGAGAVYVLPAGIGSLDLSDGLRLDADAARAFGAALAVADLDGDGLDDLVVGSPRDGAGVGLVRIWYGPVEGGSRPDATLSGPRPGAAFGAAVAATADQDGDGLGELLIGAPGDSGSAPRSGTVWLLDGAGQLAGVWSGAQTGEQAGAAVAVGGDTDGDGRFELLIGAPGASVAGAPERGAVYVVPGSAPSGILAYTGSFGGITLDGAAGGDRAGHAVAFAGDVNGDGRDDILVGGPRAVRAVAPGGLAWLVEGGGVSQSLRTATARFLSTSASQSLGHTVAGPGDLDGDGYDDVLVGAPGPSFKAGEPGAIFGFDGGPGL